MCTAPNRIVAVGVECRRVADDTWSYVSLAPWPQQSHDGSPMMSLLAAGDIAFLQLTAQLDPPGATLDQVRATLAAGRNPATITLTSGVRTVRAVEVTVGADDDTRVLATSTGSGFPPFTAAFGISLTRDDRPAVDAALRGEAGHVHITYDIETETGPARVAADLADWTRIG
ncbi:MAG: hypothetical protein IPJ61_05005 [Tessaracoccus sp.]|uniref:hypothetical protein n=1 Tax=Tessaracoccus sp. TaxID=1971211 RepID=UPI001EC20747|nr:hypothetical protein [Tessaracoccus sp.]MBK7820434.1 hypothetical protein [Tessaracoccus sp.]